MTTAPAVAPATSCHADSLASRLFLTREGRTDPYPIYHRLREQSPVHRCSLGMWLLSRYDDCRAALRDPRLGKNYARQVEQRFGPDWRRHLSLTAGEHSMLNTTGAEHTRLRKLVSRSFTPRRIAGLKPFIERTVRELLDPIGQAGGGDVLGTLGFPLPVTIIGEMLGVPAEDRPRFRTWVRDLVAVLEMKPSEEQMAAADAAQVAIRGYFFDLIADKRRRPGDDLLSALVQTGDAADDGDRLGDDELVTMAVLLFAAGFETTTNLFGNGLLGLLRAPEQMQRLRDQPSRIANLPEEFLRYDGTVQMVSRFTETSIDIGGQTIPAGEQVFMLLGAGNHDPARFADPDRLDVTRTEIEPLSFGGGVHFCLGAALARAEIEITFRQLIERFDRIELEGPEPQFQDRLTLRGLPELTVRCRSTSSMHHGDFAAVPESDTSCPHATASSPARGLRPEGGDAELRWRADLRRRIEREPAGPESLSGSAGDGLAATAALLARNRFFQGCSREQLEFLAATAYPMSFEPGDMLCVEGADSPECYVVAEGSAVVTIGRKGVGTVGEDDIIGERGVLLDTVRAATVTAMEHMITYALSRDRLRRLVEDDPSVRDWMIQDVRRSYPQLAEDVGREG